MKKQFFYAAFAVALMASCTNEENPVVDPITPEVEDKVAIELGIDSPSLIASSRSTGSVGDVTGVYNQWNSQQLYIAMVDKDGNVATDEDGTILDWETYEYRAPKYVTPAINEDGTVTNQNDISNKGLIRIYDNYTSENDNGILHHVYYPTQGKFDFYGWHVDADDDEDNGEPTIENGTAKIEGITIDGSKDIMGARTKPFDEETYGEVYTNNNSLAEYIFSARSARSKVQPILKFEHQLARLKFFVRAGSDNTALNYVNEEGELVEREERTVGETTTTEAMYVTGLSVLEMVDKIDMDLNADGEDGSTKVIKTTAAADASADAVFKLGSKQDDGQIGTLEAVAPEYNWNYDSKPAEYKGTAIGESIMFFPADKESVKVRLDLSQYLKITTDETKDDDDDDKYTWETKTQSATVLVKAADVTKGGSNAGITEFAAGHSYNVYITIYGFEEIVVSAELTPWEEGGDVEVDIEEDDVNNQPTTDDSGDDEEEVQG